MSTAFKVLALGLTFTTIRGDMLPQQLFQMPLTATNGFSLNDVAKAINAEIKAQGEEDFVGSQASTLTDLLNLRLDFVKEVIAHRQAQAAKRAGEEDRLRERRRLLELREKRKDENLEALSEEQIEARLKELDNQKG